ncbi:MAG: FAD-binding oxidoreductase [Betaproteobacteria bacterium]|jgi:glycine/D-amino acid oxidase-like deaminating enzyme|nr:FAD-binding oxidoreductase [Betaproteobacteria bacterium]
MIAAHIMPHDRSPHVVVVGGGVIGSAIACFTLRDRAFTGRVTVIERDPTYARASSALSASSIRQQFGTAVNVAIGRYGIEFLRAAAEELAVDGDRPQLGLVEPGYLYLAASAEGAATLRRNHAVQAAQGAEIALLDRAALRARFPWLAVDDLVLGAHGERGEGWFDGYSLLQAFRRKARSLGADYVAAEAGGFDVAGERIVAVALGDGTRIAGDLFVNAAGPWAAEVARWAGVDLPVRARRRSVFVFACPAQLPGCPLVIDPTGLWFRPEGAQFICGVSPDEADDADDAPLEVDHALFDDRLWPALAARVPAFEALRVTGGWAGYYEYNTFDQNGIVGPHPTVANLLLANGFSGHGMQQAPAVGRGVAELIVHGRYRTLDLSPLAYARIPANAPLAEANVI